MNNKVYILIKQQNVNFTSFLRSDFMVCDHFKQNSMKLTPSDHNDYIKILRKLPQYNLIIIAWYFPISSF